MDVGIIRKWTILLCSLCLLVGCRYVGEDRSFTFQEIETSIMQYMEDKYGQEFEIADMDYAHPIGNTVEAAFISKEDEHKNRILVTWQYEDGEEKIEDYYTFLLYKREVNMLMDQLVVNTFYDFEYATFSEIMDIVPIEKYDKNRSYINIAKTEPVAIRTRILLNESVVEEEEKIKAAILQLNEKLLAETSDKVYLMLDVYVCDNDNFYENQPLAEQFKQLYSINRKEVPFTYYDPDRVILKKFRFASHHAEEGVRIE